MYNAELHKTDLKNYLMNIFIKLLNIFTEFFGVLQIVKIY